jgi:hypothetical protein
MPRDTPYGAYNFLVDFGGGEAPTSAQGGFSDVSGLGTEITLMEYRQGNDLENRVRKIPRPPQGRRRHPEARDHGPQELLGLDQHRPPRSGA